MQRIQLDKDIRPLSEFRAHVSSYIQQVDKTKRPLVITNHGKSAAVLLNVSEYQSIVEKLDLMDDVQKAERQLKMRQGIRHKSALKRALNRMRK